MVLMWRRLWLHGFFQRGALLVADDFKWLRGLAIKRREHEDEEALRDGNDDTNTQHSDTSWDEKTGKSALLPQKIQANQALYIN